MHYIYLEKINRRGNTYKFYSLRISPDIFVDWNLAIERGRIGQPPVTFVRASGSEQALLGKLAATAKKQIRNGYSMVDFVLPSWVRLDLEGYTRSLRKLLRWSPDGSGNIYFDLSAVAELCGSANSAGSLLEAVTALREEADPRRRRRRSPRQLSNQMSLDEPPAPPRPLGTTSGDPRREVLRHFAKVLLSDDPRTLDGVLRALSPPSHVVGGNIVFFANAKKDDYVMRLSLFQAFSNNPDLLDLAHTLADKDIRTLGQLVSLSAAALISQYGVGANVLDELDIACGRYGLQLGMSMRETGT